MTDGRVSEPIPIMTFPAWGRKTELRRGID